MEIGKLSQQLRDLVGRDINSTFGVSRLSDNTIRVRIGALQQGSNDFSMVPRSESVTVLLMVPKANADSSADVARLIHVTSISQLINTVTGNALIIKPPKNEAQDIQALRDAYFPKKFQNMHVPGHPDEALLSEGKFDRWWNYVLENDVDAFGFDLNNLVCSTLASNDYCTRGKYRYREFLWAELAALQPGYVVDSLRFEVPRARKPMFFPPQTVVLEDDGKSVANAKIYYGRALTASRLSCSCLRGHGRAC